MAGLLFIVLVALVSLLGPFIRPDSTVDANDQSLVLSRMKPGTAIQEIRIKNNTPEVSFWEEWKNGGKPKNYTSIAIDSLSESSDSLSYWMTGNTSYEGIRISKQAVSYTHLTLPTKRIV